MSTTPDDDLSPGDQRIADILINPLSIPRRLLKSF